MKRGSYLILGGVVLLVLALGWWGWWWGRGTPELPASAYKNAGSGLKLDGRPLVVWFMYSYVPNVRAGSEVTAHAVNKWLLAHGWNVIVCCEKWCCDEYEGVKIVPMKRGYEKMSLYMQEIYKGAGLFCVQNYISGNVCKLGGIYKKPVMQFIHVENDNNRIVNLKQECPVYVVYNSLTVKEENPTVHPSIIVRPYVDIEKFRREGKDKSKQRYVTLINCNANKGGAVLVDLAKKMPDVEFLGIEGSYAKQVMGGTRPENLTYWPNQEDMSKVYDVTKVLIMPSAKETWGRTAVEAMAGGIPVVVSRAGGLMECVGGGGQNCRREDIGCWEETLRRLLEDEEEYSRWSASALERAGSLDVSEDLEKLGRFMRDAVGAAGS